MTQEQRLYREKCIHELALHDLYEKETDIYGAGAIIHLLAGVDTARAEEKLLRVTQYLHVPNPFGDPLRGECDFAAMNLVAASYLVKDKLKDETIAAIETFFREENFSSIYGSENHTLIMRVSRYLAARRFGCDFNGYGLTAAQVLEKDKAWLIEFMQFRGKKSFGEFDSNYFCVDMFVLGLLVSFSEDRELINLAQMTYDLMFLDLMNDAWNGFHAGGRGRCYPGEWKNVRDTHCYRLWDFYYMHQKADNMDSFSLVLTDIAPSDSVLKAIANRTLPAEILEQKHLHSQEAWLGEDIDRERLAMITGKITKYTYLCDSYGIGAIQHQDDYPDNIPGDSIYAHHQQVEWSLCLWQNPTSVFTGHPGTKAQHNEWTGDLECCCNHSFAVKDTALSIYNITHEGELPYTHAYVDASKFDEFMQDGNWLFLRQGNVYVALFAANGYTVMPDNNEVRSEGIKNAWVCRVSDREQSMEAFRERMKALPLSFNPDTMQLSFDGLFLSETENGKDGKANVYPIPYTFCCPWLISDWDSGIHRLKYGEETEVLDFINNKRYTE